MHTLTGKISQKEIEDKINYFKNLKEPAEVHNWLFLPMFYLIPKELFHGELELFSKISRSPGEAIIDAESLGIIETHYFPGIVLKFFAYYLWIVFDQKDNIEAYSLDDPIYKMVHDVAFWNNLLEEEGYIWKPDELVGFGLEYPNYKVDYKTPEQFQYIMLKIVNKANKKYDLLKMIEIVKDNRCFEDFEEIKSYPKIDFWRGWYHSKTQHPMISLEDYVENPKSYGAPQRNIPCNSSKIEDFVIDKVAIDAFKSKLNKKDMSILELRLKGYTMNDIAIKLGYANHSGVKKRIDKIGKAYQEFVKVDLGF